MSIKSGLKRNQRKKEKQRKLRKTATPYASAAQLLEAAGQIMNEAYTNSVCALGDDPDEETLLHNTSEALRYTDNLIAATVKTKRACTAGCGLVLPHTGRC